MQYDTSKSFIIDHPNKPDTHYLVHACLEGPEAGVYYRGKATITNNEYTTIQLPEYVKTLATNFTIHATPIYSGQDDDDGDGIEPQKQKQKQKRIRKIYETTEIENQTFQFQVYGPNGSFYWVVHGERKPILVEPRKENVQISGDGPYKYISSYLP